MSFLAPLLGVGAAGGAAAGAGAGLFGGGLSSLFQIGGGILGAIGSLSQASAAKAAADYNAQVNENQAITVNNDAAMRATATSIKTRQRLAAVRAAGLENGFTDSGSTADVMDTVNTSGTLDQLTQIYDGTVRSTGLRNSAQLDRMQGEAAMSAGGLSAFTSIFSGFSKAFA
jgi:hypothetical protein